MYRIFKMIYALELKTNAPRTEHHTSVFPLPSSRIMVVSGYHGQPELLTNFRLKAADMVSRVRRGTLLRFVPSSQDLRRDKQPHRRIR